MSHNLKLANAFAIRASPIIHFFDPPPPPPLKKNYPEVLSLISLGMTTIPTREIKNKGYAKILRGGGGGGQTRGITGNVQMANSFNLRDTYCRE